MGYEQELQVAKEAAREAGRVMQRYQEDGFSVETKRNATDPVTDADRAAQDAIISILQEHFPEDGVLGEEDGVRPDGEARVWVVDPIDGTTNYSRGIPYYCTSIGLEVRDEPVAGVVYDPVRDRLFAAEKGEGATLNGKPITVSDTRTLDGAILSIQALPKEGGSPLLDDEIRVIRDLLERPATTRMWGAIALDLCAIAAGWSEGTVRATTHPWDVSAGTLIIREAGGTVRREDRDGERLALVASNNHVQEHLEEVFDRHVR